MLELLHLRRERSAVQRPVRPPDRGGDAVDRVGAAEEAAGARRAPAAFSEAIILRTAALGIVAEHRRERDEVVVRHLRARRVPVRAVAGPRVEDRRLVVERAEARDERGQLAERGRRDVDVGLVRVQLRDRGADVVRARRVALAVDDLAAELRGSACRTPGRRS